MKLVQGGISKFINYSLKILFLIILTISCMRLGLQYLKADKYTNLIFICCLSIYGLIVYYQFKIGTSTRKIYFFILLVSVILRITWVLSINNVPYSDFAGMYERSRLVLEGEFYIFKGHCYYARFPHLTMTVLYFSVIRKFFIHPLITLKLINAICSTADVLLCGLIAKEIFNSDIKGICAGFIASVFPPFIIYSAVYCGENIAIPFYLLSSYIFVLVFRKQKPAWFLVLSSISLSVGNLFRMVAVVVVIAYIIYMMIYERASIIKKIINSSYILCGFIIPLLIGSCLLKGLGVTEFNLWHGSESPWTSILKGSNLQSYGRYNEEDSEIVTKYNYDYYMVEDACKEIVKERLTQTPLQQLTKFYLRKFSYQWREGDFGGVYWAKGDIQEKDMLIDLEETANIYIQLFYFSVVFLTYLGLFNKNQYLKNPIINLFYIIFCGYGLLYLITESQDRYSFIVSWLFVLLPLTTINPKEYLVFIFNNNKMWRLRKLMFKMYYRIFLNYLR